MEALYEALCNATHLNSSDMFQLQQVLGVFGMYFSLLQELQALIYL